ncbi:hypothetical protein ACROAG_09540 [Shewanella oncorhynchi]|jgi:hypothetical protein|uniref:hypothetical protein n=1 Tax=Shewanella TaxID=22 RepID=UPI0021DA3E1F|nr:hypothetical protein [Shewanella sp. SM87]MCU8010225.1 hypothetical protein [Shewanella sp. SM87]
MDTKQLQEFMRLNRPMASNFPKKLATGQVISELKIDCKCGSELKDELVRGSVNIVESSLIYRGIGICDNCMKILCLNGAIAMVDNEMQLSINDFGEQTLRTQ